jgi:hypothetical protein
MKTKIHSLNFSFLFAFDLLLSKLTDLRIDINKLFSRGSKMIPWNGMECGMRKVGGMEWKWNEN